jgi:hypothetical protein
MEGAKVQNWAVEPQGKQNILLPKGGSWEDKVGGFVRESQTKILHGREPEGGVERL